MGDGAGCEAEILHLALTTRQGCADGPAGQLPARAIAERGNLEFAGSPHTVLLVGYALPDTKVKERSALRKVSLLLSAFTSVAPDEEG